MSTNKTFITLKEASEILGVSKDTRCRWDKAGKLKTKRYPMNNFRIYDPGDVEALRNTILKGINCIQLN